MNPCLCFCIFFSPRETKHPLFICPDFPMKVQTWNLTADMNLACIKLLLVLSDLSSFDWLALVWKSPTFHKDSFWFYFLKCCPALPFPKLLSESRSIELFRTQNSLRCCFTQRMSPVKTITLEFFKITSMEDWLSEHAELVYLGGKHSFQALMCCSALLVYYRQFVSGISMCFFVLPPLMDWSASLCCRVRRC